MKTYIYSYNRSYGIYQVFEVIGDALRQVAATIFEIEAQTICATGQLPKYYSA